MDLATRNSALDETLAIIGGSGFYSLAEKDDIPEALSIPTPYSAAPVKIQRGNISNTKVFFIARHGEDHSIPPHKINYRANLWALKELGVKQIIAVNAVGGIQTEMEPGQIVMPDQIIDYTYGREQTFFDGLNHNGLSEENSLENHIDFTFPYDQKIRNNISALSKKLNLSIMDIATYACTQGPRLETVAEVSKLRNDGCDIVGMTGMPEAALARELEMNYVCLALVVNKAAGLGEELITITEIQKVMNVGIVKIRNLLNEIIKASEN